MTARNAWKAIPLARTLGIYADEWDKLNERCFDAHPMFDSRFVDCLLKYFGDGREQLLRLDDQGEIGLCLLRPSRLGIWSSFFPSQTQAAPVFLNTDKNLPSIFTALPRWASQIDFLGQDPNFSPVRDSLAKPRRSIDHAKTISINLDGGFDNYWNGRSRNLIKNIKRYKNRIMESGAIASLVCIDAPEEIPAAVVRYGHLESNSWKGREGTAVEPDNVQGKFYAEMMESFAGSGNALVYEFWIDGELAASRLVIANKRMLVILKTAYDESMSSYAPGRLLLYEVIRDAFNRIPGGTLEFYTNATQDQLAWATHQRLITHQTIFRSEAQALLWQFVRTSKRFLSRTQASERPLVVETFDGATVTAPDEYAELFAQSERVAFDFGWPWFSNLISTVSLGGGTARFYAGRSEGRPLATLPMCLPVLDKGAKGEALGNYYTTLYQPILSIDASAEDLCQVICAIARDRPELAELHFSPLDPAAPATIILRNALQAAGWITFNYFAFGNWYLPVTGTWHEYLNGRSGKLHNTIIRMRKKFAASGGRLQILTEAEQLDAGIAAFAKVYAGSWKKPEPHAEFVPGLIRMLAATHRLRLGIAWLQDQPIAAQIWILNHGKANIYKLAYDERFATYSPGTVLAAHLMEHVIDNDKVYEVDYLVGDDTYKRMWMSHRRERWGLAAFNPQTLRGLALIARECLSRTVKWIVRRRESPRDF